MSDEMEKVLATGNNRCGEYAPQDAGSAIGVQVGGERPRCRHFMNHPDVRHSAVYGPHKIEWDAKTWTVSAPNVDLRGGVGPLRENIDRLLGEYGIMSDDGGTYWDTGPDEDGTRIGSVDAAVRYLVERTESARRAEAVEAATIAAKIHEQAEELRYARDKLAEALAVTHIARTIEFKGLIKGAADKIGNLEGALETIKEQSGQPEVIRALREIARHAGIPDDDPLRVGFARLLADRSRRRHQLDRIEEIIQEAS